MLMIYVALFLFGLIAGSFVNALVWRLNKQLDKDGNPKKKVSSKYSISKGRSMCPHCEHELSAIDLVPLFSWLSLKGRCRYCNKPISWQYPLVEFITGLLFGLSYVFWPYEASTASLVAFCLWLVLLTGLVALALYDLKWMLLPNRLIYPLLGLSTIITAITWAYLNNDINPLSIAVSLAISSGLFYLMFLFSGGKWIGGGDVKYGLIAGVLLAQPALAFLYIVLASFLGSIVIIGGLATKKITTKSRIPFGPFLIASTIIVLFFGQSIIDWYRQMILLG